MLLFKLGKKFIVERSIKMFTIIRDRDSGKAKQLMEIAIKNHGTILTQNKRALLVKAHSYGFENLNIIDYDDLRNGDYHLPDTPVYVHNGDKVLSWLLEKYYGIKIDGFSATLDENY